MKYIGLFDEKEDIVTKEKLDAKQDKITVNGIVQGDGNGNLSAAQTVNGETIELNAASVGLGNVDNVKQYSATNPPPYPVTSVNTKTGAVELTASDVGAQASITVSGILKGDGAGGVSAAVADTDYATCTNLRNGSRTGSLRTTGSIIETQEYSLGENAFAEGSGTSTRGVASHAEGIGTTANGKSQHVQGEYNIHDGRTIGTIRGTYAHIVGNGTPSARSNAHTLDWSGNAWFAGDVYVGSTSGTHKDEGSKKLIKEGDAGLLPTVTTADNGKFLRVVSGAWAAATVDNANGGSF